MGLLRRLNPALLAVATIVGVAMTSTPALAQIPKNELSSLADGVQGNCYQVRLEQPVRSLLELPANAAPFHVLYKVPLWGDYAIVGGMNASDADGERSDEEMKQVIRQQLQMWVDGKRASMTQGGIDLELAQKDLAALLGALASEQPYVITGYQVGPFTVEPPGDREQRLIPIACEAAATSSSASDEAVSQSIPCPPIIGPTLPICPKERDPNKWAANSGYWDMHYNHIDGPWIVHILFMYTTWTSNSRLSLYTSNNDGFEVNTYLKQDIDRVGSSDIWGSDYPGAYLETLTFDDDTPTFAIGTDRAESLVAGRQYQNQIWVKSPVLLTLKPLGYYQQVDLDMVSNGDRGFYVDDSCCSRSMYVGQWQNW